MKGKTPVFLFSSLFLITVLNSKFYDANTVNQAIKKQAGYMRSDKNISKVRLSSLKTWNTFLGNKHIDHGWGITTDINGNIYVIGASYGTWGTPVNAHAGQNDALVAKLTSSGELIWHTFLGSAKNEFGRAIAVDSVGNVYVTGECDETWGNPVIPYSDGEVFVTKLDNSGNIIWNT
ncbi:MAG: SBBP repeat-containing protein, partial [Dehalococcoidia bacterium]